jgi:nucleoside-diphosphate-sugar epimerase
LRGLPAEIVPGDLGDLRSVERALEGIDLLFHAAAPYPSRHFGMTESIHRSVKQVESLLRITRERTATELLAGHPRRSRQVALEQAAMAAQVRRSQPERSPELERSVRDPTLLAAAENGRLDASLHPPLLDCRGLRGLKRVIYTSSATTIGRPSGSEPGRPTDRLAGERDRYDLAPDPSPYFTCKRLMESAVVRAANEGLPATILNPTLVVGAGDAHRTTGRLLLPYAKGEVPFYLPGRINAVPAADVGEGHVLAALHGRTGQRYILGGEEMRLGDFLRIVATEAGISAPRIRVPRWVAEPIALFTELVAAATGAPWARFPVHGLRMLRHTPQLDASLAVRELGWIKTPVADAVREAIDWYRQEGML